VRGLDLTYETIRRWGLKFGSAFAKRHRHQRPRPSARWHLLDGIPGHRPEPAARAGTANEQLRGEFASAEAAPTEVPAVQIGRLCPTIPVRPCRRLRRLQAPAPSRIPTHISRTSSRRCQAMGGRFPCRVTGRALCNPGAHKYRFPCQSPGVRTSHRRYLDFATICRKSRSLRSNSMASSIVLPAGRLGPTRRSAFSAISPIKVDTSSFD